MLAQQDIEDDSVDLIVDPVIGHHADFWTRLTKAIDPALALLVSSRAP